MFLNTTMGNLRFKIVKCAKNSSSDVVKKFKLGCGKKFKLGCGKQFKLGCGKKFKLGCDKKIQARLW